MIEEFQSHSFRDFAQRYQDTYGWFLGSNNKKVLVKLVGVESKALKFIDREGTPYTANADKGNFFEFIPLEKSLYTYQGKLTLVQRIPARQWRRGIHHNNTSIFFVNQVIGANIDVHFDVLDVILKPTHHSDCLETYLKGNGTEVAINPMFGVAGKSLYVYNRVIGSLDKNKVSLHNDLFKQEVADMIRDHQLPWVM